jgi:AraC family transcriptional regulator
MVGLRVSTYQANTRMAPHRHDDCSFCVVVSGSYREHIRDQNAEHGNGHMLFYPAGEVHSQEFGMTNTRKIIFTPSLSSLEFLSERRVVLTNAPAVHGSIFSALANRVLSEIRKPDQFAELVVQGLLLEMIAAFARAGDSTKLTHTVPIWLRQVRELLQESAVSDLTNETIGMQVGKHPVHVAREFRKHFGQTIGEYHRHLRLKKAEMLLRAKNLSLTDVALESGFCSHAHLSRSFKSAYGVTPSIFRSQRL